MNDTNRNDDEGDSHLSSDKENKLLEEFRQQWKKELKADDFAVVKSNDADNVSSNQKIDEDKVKHVILSRNKTCYF